MYTLGEMETGEKSNRSFTYVNPCFCCCPNVIISLRIMAIADIVLHSVLIVVAMARMPVTVALSYLVLLGVIISASVCIFADVCAFTGGSYKWVKKIFPYLLYLWVIGHIVMFLMWILVAAYVVDQKEFKDRNKAKVVADKAAVIYSDSIELAILLFFYLWFGWVIAGFMHYIKNSKIYRRRTYEDGDSDDSDTEECEPEDVSEGNVVI